MRTIPRTLPLTLVTLALALPACLSEGSRGSVDTDTTTSTGDTTSTTPGDTTTVTGDADTSPPTCPASCDDGDPCTRDYCDEATGTCKHEAYLTTGDAISCTSDTQCTSGDPCYVGECVIAPAECGGGAGYCEYRVVPGCNDGCQIAGCDDGDPCTVDVCQADGNCLYDTVENCTARCGSGGVTPIDELRVGAGAAKIAGVARLGQYAACDDGPECRCMGTLVLAEDDQRELALDGGTNLAWGCVSTGCVEVTERCQPMVAGAAYWAWGQPVYGTPFPNGIAIALPGGMIVEDYCLQTNAAGLIGDYDGQLQTDFGTFDFTARVERSGDGALFLFIETECNDCDNIPVLPSQTATLDLYDGEVGVALKATRPSDEVTVRIAGRLQSERSSLSGPVFDEGPASDAQQGAEPPQEDPGGAQIPLPTLDGTLTLTRRN